jgi:hypothetical protein
MASMRKIKKAYKVLFGHLKGKDDVGDLSIDGTMRIDLTKIECQDVRWIHMAFV